MCVYPRLIPNPKYLPNKKNKGNPATPSDYRLMTTAIGCGKCFECREQYARDWKIRMYEELRGAMQQEKAMHFVTLTFSEEKLQKYINETINEETGEISENEAATLATRHFLERWRKKHKKSLRHWLITELGHTGTERLHIHGIIIVDKPITREYLFKYWQNGWADNGEYVNLRTIGYITKYITKIDKDHPEFTGKILCSSGIGDWYFKAGHGKRFNEYCGLDTKEYYRSKQGYKMSLPIYYRNHIYTEKEREKLWLQKLDKQKTWLDGVEYDISTNDGINKYQRALKEAQKKNKKLNYGKIEWDWEIYNKSIKYLNINKTRNILAK